MRRIINAGLYVLFVLVFFEVVSFVVVLALSDQGRNEHLAAAVSNFHPLFKSQPSGGLRAPYERDDATNPFRFDPRTGYAFRPNTLYSTSIAIGPDGFICGTKCEPLGKIKPSGEFRAFVLGGSSVAGSGISNNEATIPARLQEILRTDPKLSTHNAIRVINAGVGGFFSNQELAYTINTLAQYDPDLVIFLDGYNDYIQWHYINYYPYAGRYAAYLDPSRQLHDYQLMEGWHRIRSPGGAILHTLNLAMETYPILYYMTTLAKHVRAMLLYMPPAAGMTKARADEPLKPLAPLEDTEKPSVASYLRNLDLASGAINAIGARGLFCLQPTLPLREPDGKPRKKELVGIEKDYVNSQTAVYLTDYYRLAEAGFRARIQNNNEHRRFCSLTDLLNDIAEEIYIDEIHYNDRGAWLVAEGLAEQIRLMLAPARTSQ